MNRDALAFTPVPIPLVAIVFTRSALAAITSKVGFDPIPIP